MSSCAMIKNLIALSTICGLSCGHYFDVHDPIQTTYAGTRMPVFASKNNILYFFGGDAITVQYGNANKGYKYDPNTDKTKMIPIADAPEAMMHSMACIIGKIMYAEDYNGYIQKYDIINDKWDTNKISQPSGYIGRRGCMACDKNKIYMIMGFNGHSNTPTNWVRIYDLSTKTWDTTKTSPESGAYGNCVYVKKQKKIYMIYTVPNNKNLLIFDTKTLAFSEKQNILPQPPSFPMLFYSKIYGKLQIIGGYNSVDITSITVDRSYGALFDVSVDPYDKLPANRGGSALLLDRKSGIVYLISGGTGYTNINSDILPMMIPDWKKKVMVPIMNKWQIHLSMSQVNIIGGLLILILLFNVCLLYYVNCLKQRKNGYGVVKFADSEVDELNANEI